MFGFLRKIFGTAQDRQVRRYFKIVDKINAYEAQYQQLTDDQLRAKTAEFKERIKKGETLDQLMPEAYAVVKNVCRRLCGSEVHVSGYNQKWDMVPYDVQLVGGIALHHNCISEMQTGEGKTLTASLPLYLNALTERPVHLVTVNDYLAQRDCQWMGPILNWLGLTTGALTNDVPQEQRKEIYKYDVVYGTASEFGFDYLRDNSMAFRKEEQVQRGFYYAIVDEVDSILIDEARTPLIISGPVPVSRQLYDELKGGVGDLVRLQRDFCNRLATEARKVLEKDSGEGGGKKDKKQQQEEDDAYRKLWTVGKGTPTNKILTRLKEDPVVRGKLDEWDLYFHGDGNKEERTHTLANLYIIVDERANEYELTDKGIQAWLDSSSGHNADDFTMFDIGYEFSKIDADPEKDDAAKMQAKLTVQEEDAHRKERAHNLRQLLRAHLLMEKDVDYMIQDQKIVIIDENTGRAQPGRRFSDGLHQAIEAKEGLPIQKETQTYATVTLQNYFRMYDKLAGMTGTAMTEANEFKQIYKMDVLEIPTHRTCRRTEFNDEIYMTEREKYNAILKEINEVHGKGRPILIGTESVEISEKLSRICKQHKLEHTVLNAKQNDKEAEIVANAGQPGAITISTNMAGRGTDIKLSPGMADLGGLHVIGTTRHQSRRIDRQLRGRSARQGDPGSAKFFVSFEDSLLRLFASPRMTAVLQRFRPPEGEPISAGILNKSIETAQKRIEQRNYVIRKHTLEYDDVMNKQRHEIYAFRNDVLRTDNIEAIAEELIESVVGSLAEENFRNRGEEGAWNPENFRQELMRRFPVTFEENAFDQDYVDVVDLEKMASEKIVAAFREKLDRENSKFLPPDGIVDPNRPRPTTEAMRNLIIRKIDQQWQEHLLVMDHLRTDVNLRSVGQRDPLLEFKQESFRLFDALSRNLKGEIAQDLFRFEMMVRTSLPTLEQLLSVLRLEKDRSLVSELEEEAPAETNEAPRPEEKAQPVVVGPKTGRNDNCPCGSGKKYKKCCGADKEE